MDCESCKHAHGPLYICESYSEEKKAEIRKQEAQMVVNLQDPEWCRKQMANGVPAHAIGIFRAFMGIDPENQ